MLTFDVLAFLRGALAPPPLRVLEIGAGQGELAAALRAADYEVTAIDPAAEPGSDVSPIPLLEAEGRFDAAVTVVALHHVEPLEESCAHLAQLIVPGGLLVIDELDVTRIDERAAAWWLGRRRALGFAEEGREPGELAAAMGGHIHPLRRIEDALRAHFELGLPVRGPYLHRWELAPDLRGAEEQLIAEGRLPATGARLIATRANESARASPGAAGVPAPQILGA